jgi:hypothetical protein
MRRLLPLLFFLAIAGCAYDYPLNSGISRATAISIAERYCSQFPYRYGYVEHAEWYPDGRFWLVALTDYNGYYGRAYKISPEGAIISSRYLDRAPSNGYDDYGPRGYNMRPDW